LPSSFHSDQKFDGILVSGKCVYESGCGSNSFLVGANKQQAVSFREAYGRSGSEDDNASGVGFDPPGDDRGDTFGCEPPRDNSSGAEAPSTIKGIINVNVASAAPASSTAAAAATATAAAASPAAGASSLYSISTHGPDGSRDLELGFLVPLPSGFNSGEFRLVGFIGSWCTPPLRGSQGRRGSFLIRGA